MTHPETTGRVISGHPVFPVEITRNKAGHTLVDFGRHFFGWIEVEAPMPGPFTFVWGQTSAGSSQSL